MAMKEVDGSGWVGWGWFGKWGQEAESGRINIRSNGDIRAVSGGELFRLRENSMRIKYYAERSNWLTRSKGAHPEWMFGGGIGMMVLEYAM